jgi:phospholipid/cholesterol/gamma-HCH transport system permease protein
VALLKLARAIRNAGGSCEQVAASQAAESGLALYRFEQLMKKESPPEPEHAGFFEYVGEVWYTCLSAFSGLTVLIYDSAYWFFVAPLRGKGFKAGTLVKEISRNGVHAIPILSLISFLFGLVMSINGAYLLTQWGQNQLIADMVGVGLTREIAPVVVGIMLAARSGAAIAAELGTMQVREEIDAMWAMGMNPAKFLIVPRVTALALAGPVLSLVANVVGMLGSFLASTIFFGVAGRTFLRRLEGAIYLNDIITGLGKSLVFGLLIGFVGCWFGMSVEGSAEEVGDATTRAVVWSIVLIIVADGVFSSLFYILST